MEEGFAGKVADCVYRDWLEEGRIDEGEKFSKKRLAIPESPPVRFNH